MRSLNRLATACQADLKRLDAGETILTILGFKSNGETQGIDSAPDADDLKSSANGKVMSEMMAIYGSVSEDAAIGQNDSEPSPVELPIAADLKRIDAGETISTTLEHESNGETQGNDSAPDADSLKSSSNGKARSEVMSLLTESVSEDAAIGQNDSEPSPVELAIAADLKRIDAGETISTILEHESNGETQGIDSAPDADDLKSSSNGKAMSEVMSIYESVSEDAAIGQIDSKPSPVELPIAADLKRIDAGETTSTILEHESNGETQGIESAPDADDLKSSSNEKAMSEVMSLYESVSEDAAIGQNDSEPSPVEVSKSDLSPVSFALTSISPNERGTQENEDTLKRSASLLSILLSACDATPEDYNLPVSHEVYSEKQFGLENQKIPSAHQLTYQHYPPLVHQLDQKPHAWYAFQYQDYEAAFVDEVLAAEMFPPSSQLFVSRPLMSGQEAEVVSSPEQVKDPLVDTSKSLYTDRILNSQDTAFINKILANATAVEQRQREVLFDIRRALQKRYGRQYDVESFGSSR
ncbi:hypothetical protein C0992_013271 [Termitomyces sp. T32_za158]|nr:hypothetical protein C0992_013271 [Termitomyces sp. T32_za158]